MSITCRGQGKQISAQECAAWHPDVQVRFQKKAWADDELCEEVARVEIARRRRLMRVLRTRRG